MSENKNLRKCTRCHSTKLEKYFSINTKGEFYKTCDNCRKHDVEYREQNKDKIKAKKKEYNENNKDKVKEYQLKYNEANKDKIAEKNKQYREQHKDRIRAYDRARTISFSVAIDGEINPTVTLVD